MLRHPVVSHAAAALISLALVTPAAGCDRAAVPVRESRPALGTVVTIDAYAPTESAARDGIGSAFQAIAAVEHALDAHSPTSTIAAFNADPYSSQKLPDDAVEILDAIEDLGVGEEFSPGLLAVVRLYGFDATPTVPSPADLRLAVDAARAFTRPSPATGAFERLRVSDTRLDPGGALAPGLDFGGAAKGLALDRAREALRASGVTAAIVTAGSTTVTLGTKPDGSPWRIGVEHPRAAGSILAVAEWSGDAALSTSGDYQRFFERDGVRYHHILDPRSGTPAHGAQSLTVTGRISGLASDILSTALFVRGAAHALEHAQAGRCAVLAVDAHGRAVLADGAPEDGVSVTLR